MTYQQLLDAIELARELETRYYEARSAEGALYHKRSTATAEEKDNASALTRKIEAELNTEIIWGL